jgi:hypothetical protein
MGFIFQTTNRLCIDFGINFTPVAKKPPARAGVFLTICDKPKAIFSNKRKLSFFGEMTAEPVFKRFRRVFLGQKKCGAYGARTRNLCRDRAAL